MTAEKAQGKAKKLVKLSTLRGGGGGFCGLGVHLSCRDDLHRHDRGE